MKQSGAFVEGTQSPGENVHGKKGVAECRESSHNTAPVIARNAPTIGDGKAGTKSTGRPSDRTGISSQFRPAVIERFGACCDSLVGFINMLCGDGDRDALRADDYTFSASSRTTYMASLLVFGTVISDAAMVDRVICMDVKEAAAARDRVPRRDRGMGEPDQDVARD